MLTQEITRTYLDALERRFPALSECREEILGVYEILVECYRSGGKLLVAGNGGSAADAEHIVGELMKGFVLPRPVPEDFARALWETDPVRGGILAGKLQRGLAAIALDGHPALTTAYLNDVENGGIYVFAEQVYGYGRAGDVFLGISTSGSSENVLSAAVVARAIGMPVVALVGGEGGALGRFADLAVRVPETETHRVQEMHLPVYHTLCLMLEERFFGGEG